MNRKTCGCHRFPLFSTASFFFTAKSIYAVLAASLLPYQSPTHGLLARLTRGRSGARSRDECPAHHVYQKVFAELNSFVQEGLLPTYAETLMNPNAIWPWGLGAVPRHGRARQRACAKSGHGYGRSPAMARWLNHRLSHGGEVWARSRNSRLAGRGHGCSASEPYG